MIKDVLKQKEFLAYISLRNDLRFDKLAQSYLFYGELNPLKKEASFLLAQSIIEGKGDFACETCSTCKRIRNGNYLDVFYFDGHKKSIKSDDVEKMMMEFSKTSFEKAGKKVYIIDNVNNSSAKVLNMLLKFMEEPSNKNTYGIFISDNIDELLPTVVSRCRKVEFKTKDFSYLIKEYENSGFENTDAYLLSKIKHEYVDLDLNDECYLNAKEYVYKTIDNLNNPEVIPLIFFNEFYTLLPKEKFKLLSDYYIDIMLVLIEDSIVFNTRDDNEYNNCLNILRQKDNKGLLEIFLKAKSKKKVAVNRQMLFDQIAAQIISL